jgi:hypothetical protein
VEQAVTATLLPVRKTNGRRDRRKNSANELPSKWPRSCRRKTGRTGAEMRQGRRGSRSSGTAESRSEKTRQSTAGSSGQSTQRRDRREAGKRLMCAGSKPVAVNTRSVRRAARSNTDGRCTFLPRAGLSNGIAKGQEGRTRRGYAARSAIGSGDRLPGASSGRKRTGRE